MSSRLSAARAFASRLLRRTRGIEASAPAAVVPARDDNVATIGDLDPRTLAPDATIAFHCNLCGARARATLAALAREKPSCPSCRSTVRFRAIAHLLVRELLGEDAILPNLSPRPSIRGIGLSDAECYAAPLARVFDYANTWFHKAPRVDIAAIDDAQVGRYDFLVASDVFEHVVPPVGRAFVNARRLLKPGGLFVMTVPFSLEAATVEHFPGLHDWSLGKVGGVWLLVNKTADGLLETHRDLVFHGGPGSTLEMRVFARDALLAEFERAGFVDVRIASEPYLPFGIHWPEPWSLPIVARAPAAG
jgi:SAM-dependent methyltransferase